jgi:hypothetical protein
MNCNFHVLYKMIFSNKFGFILETVFSYSHYAESQLSVTMINVVMLSVVAPITRQNRSKCSVAKIIIGLTY